MSEFNLNEKVAITIAVLAVLIFFVGVLFGFGTPILDLDSSQDRTGDSAREGLSEQDINELKVEELQVGEGEVVEEGDTVTVHYVGKLNDGSIFDTSLGRGEPLTFTIGEGMVIEGWEVGLLGANEGSVVRLSIPSEMAYGNQEVGGIPANSDLFFEVQVIEVEKE